MKGFSCVVSALGLALWVSTSMAAGVPTLAVDSSGGLGSFFSRLFSGGDDARSAEPAAATPKPEQQEVAEPVQKLAASQAQRKTEATLEPWQQVARAQALNPVDDSGLDAHEVLKRADQSRGNLQGISWNVEIEAKEKGHVDSTTYDIKARGFNISGINLAPPKSKGQKLLMQENNMWFHKPGLSKPIPISMRQKLMGQASYGDVASTNYAEDYDAIRLADETVDGVDCYVFDLKSRNSRTTYDRIIYWVDKERMVGVKADYYTLSGKRFKSANMEYGSKVRIGEEIRPFISEITIYEELMSGDVTTLSMTKPKLSPLPDYIFNINLFMK